MASLGNDKKYFVKFTINMILMHIHTYVQIISNNSGSVPLVDSWFEYTVTCDPPVNDSLYCGVQTSGGSCPPILVDSETHTQIKHTVRR